MTPCHDVFRSNVVANQVNAMYSIFYLSTKYPFLQDSFRECSSSVTLGRIVHGLATEPYTSASREEFSQLISNSKYAFLSTLHSEINDAAKYLYNSVKPTNLVVEAGSPFSILLQAMYE